MLSKNNWLNISLYSYENNKGKVGIYTQKQNKIIVLINKNSIIYYKLVAF